MVEMHSMQLETYAVIFTRDALQIGCQNHPIDDWYQFTDEEISSMYDDALEFWRKWKGQSNYALDKRIAN